MTYNDKKSLYESIMNDVAKIVKKHLNEFGEFSEMDNIENLDKFRINLISGVGDKNVYVEYKIYKIGVRKFFEIHYHKDKNVNKPSHFDYRYIAQCDEEKGMKWRIEPFIDGKQVRGGWDPEPNFHSFIVSKYKEKILQMVEKSLGKKCREDLAEKIKNVVN
jgi:hypothetical protein